MNNAKIQKPINQNIKYITIMDSVEWMEWEQDHNTYCKSNGYAGNAYVYSMSPHILRNPIQTFERKRFGKIYKEKIKLNITNLDKISDEKNRIWRANRCPKNYPSIFSKIGFSENIAARIQSHKNTWKRGFHLNGMVKFPDAISAKSFEAFCFDFYKEYSNKDYKSFFQSNEVFLLPAECISMNDALQEYMKSQKNLNVESLYFWC